MNILLIFSSRSVDGSRSEAPASSLGRCRVPESNPPEPQPSGGSKHMKQGGLELTATLDVMALRNVLTVAILVHGGRNTQIWKGASSGATASSKYRGNGVVLGIAVMALVTLTITITLTM